MSTAVFIALIFLVGSFVHGAVGFGSALVAVPLAVGVIGVHNTTPLMALVGFVLALVALVRYRQALDMRAMLGVIVAAVVGIPVGVAVLTVVDAERIDRVLGGLLVVYALYALWTPRLPLLAGRGWAAVFGFGGGVLTGAFAIGGPPIIVYGTCRRWPPNEFKGNLQSYFLATKISLIAAQVLSGNVTPLVGQYFLVALPASIGGLLTGIVMARYIGAKQFQRVVLILLIIIGLRLLIT